jgi:hypothetical protein
MSRVPTGKQYVIKTLADFTNVPLDFLAESMPDIIDFLALIYQAKLIAKEKGMDIDKLAGDDWAHLVLIDDGVRGLRKTEFFDTEKEGGQ